MIAALLLAGCSHHKAPPPNARLSDSITIIAGLSDQLQGWHGTPYHYGGMTRCSVDCSGFVVVTMRDRFDLQLPRKTKQQTSIDTQIDKDELLPDDLAFFKARSERNGLHVDIHDTNNQFIHASTSEGMVHSPLDNVYWQKSFWQAKRIQCIEKWTAMVHRCPLAPEYSSILQTKIPQMDHSFMIRIIQKKGP